MPQKIGAGAVHGFDVVKVCF